MKIAVDIDGVLGNLIDGFIDFMREHHNIIIKKEDFKTWDFQKALKGYSYDEVLNFIYEFFETKHFKECSVIDGSLDALTELKKENELLIVSARQKFLTEISKDWICKNFPGIFTSINILDNPYGKNSNIYTKKSDFCEKNCVDVIIEDDLSFVKDFNGKTKVLLFDQPWNRKGELNENVVRVKNWDEVLVKIKRLR